KKGALLATVQFKATLWTASFEVDPDRQDHCAGGTPCHLALSRHGRGLRPELFLPGDGLLLGPLALAARVLVSPLSVLAFHPYSFRREESLSVKDLPVSLSYAEQPPTATKK